MNPQYIQQLQQQKQPGPQYVNSFGVPSCDGPQQNIKVPQQYPTQKLMSGLSLPPQKSGIVPRPAPPILTESSNALSQNPPIIQQRPPMVGGSMPIQQPGLMPQQQGRIQNHQPGYPINYQQNQQQQQQQQQDSYNLQRSQYQLGANMPGTSSGYPVNQPGRQANGPDSDKMPLQQPGQILQQPGRIQNFQQPGYPINYTPQPLQDLYNIQRNQYQQPGVNMPGTTSPGYQPSQQGQQAKRLDPDTMPSPIQVMQDDQKTRGGEFITNQKGLVPPFVTTKFIVKDQGNASPRFIRSTIYAVPTTSDIMKQTGVPFGLIISPMAKIVDGENEPPIVNMGDMGPVRCVRCKAYMCPFMQFIDAGRRFQCLFCHATTEVPSEYFQHLDHTGQRMDRYERPELMLGTYEFIATKDYCRNNTIPKPPVFIFVIDVSYNNIKSGLINLICSEMKNILKNLPKDTSQDKTKMKVGFITYSNTVHFYNINSNLTQPQMMVVGDVHEIFMPLLDGFLCDANESGAVIDSLMTQIPSMFADTRETETILAPAIQAGIEALKASGCPGKLIVLHSSLPIAEAPGKLKNRDDRKLLGTDKEKTILAPQNNIYNNLGQDCVNVGCSVDLYLFNNSYIDIATIGQVCRLSGGEVFKYTYFQADTDGDRLITDIINNISRPIAFDSVMRVRTSTGVRPTDFYGHFYMSNTTDMEIASIDCNKAIGVEIKHDDKLNDDDGVYIQVALLYTSCSGIRRLRIINLSLKTSSQMAELYRTCDPDAIINFFSKQCVFELSKSTPKLIKDNLITKCATILGAYRKHCALPFSASRLVLPECMKLLPLYVNCLLKSDALSGGSDMTVDDRSYIMMVVSTMPVYTSVIYFYPRLLPLHDININDDDLPQQLRCSIDKFIDDGAFLLENGIHMFFWLGLGLSAEWIQAVFGSPVADTDRTSLPVIDNPLNKRVRDIIAQVRAERHHCMRLTIVRQRDKLEMVLRHFLVEDRGNDGSPGYVDFLCHMHKEIKALLNQ
ncbi:hypothetical protein HCN44_011003 [Aphidius gifuensis]|uniref:Protein transport protein Sec24C n=1 Tax=Aphidius gifuensis TaxID=684658 RepID=A0A834Y3A0_APHGI|nr:protein transport protein Sec24C-like [Aphidius gifuensis]XP_044004923.1 protein transport protein Sec24C-like [Aphidius gifuensis]XP_044004932.1 protein transport protein Sec24C-like [Aphidius gifuensis]XP_044004941.1 protein transport protein Sec24C-like [Aphidius gifuensis]KAF7998595.1 hypothetical protein HCN44_011003 [Aphidius gifuensis]